MLLGDVVGSRDLSNRGVFETTLDTACRSVDEAVAGDIDVGVGSGRVPAMDGPAFHRAEEMLSSVADADLLFDLAVSESTLDRAIADEVNLLLRWRAGLTERQAEYVRAYERRGTQAAAAADLGVTQQAVSNELRDVGWPFVDRIERRLERTIEEYADAT